MQREAGFVDKNIHLLQLLGGIVATALTITIFLYSTFVTKETQDSHIKTLKEFEEYRLDRIESKLDKLDDKISNLTRRK